MHLCAHSFELCDGCAQLITLPNGGVYPSPSLQAEQLPSAAYGAFLAPALDISGQKAPTVLPPWSLALVRKDFPSQETGNVQVQCSALKHCPRGPGPGSPRGSRQSSCCSSIKSRYRQIFSYSFLLPSARQAAANLRGSAVSPAHAHSGGRSPGWSPTTHQRSEQGPGLQEPPRCRPERAAEGPRIELCWSALISLRACWACLFYEFSCSAVKLKIFCLCCKLIFTYYFCLNNAGHTWPSGVRYFFMYRRKSPHSRFCGLLQGRDTWKAGVMRATAQLPASCTRSSPIYNIVLYVSIFQLPPTMYNQITFLSFIWFPRVKMHTLLPVKC